MNFNIYRGFQKDEYFGGWRGMEWDGGMVKLWIFLGGIAKLDYFWELFQNILGLFLKDKIQNWNNLWVANFQ